MADGAKGEDELARTATAPGSGRPLAAAPALGTTLGRYRLDRALGEGGMGVVHAAFDPDLERRVALKVLRTSDAGEARQRLLREARAMARLTHANVVTVHEVGSANGRDYVAMELIEGETLADWLRAGPRRPDEIVTAFVAAGRGLAAAHAAGLVHRDFKPHNVLRRRDGRICVTDFGLARGVDATPGALDATLQTDARERDNTPSPLSGLTATGSVLGTPAYMAPEQWDGGSIGPAADQFAYCVALWEALTGERPFRGATLDELKREVARGPDALDASKLPRRLRHALRRGLDPDPAKRWPSMDELITAIGRADRRPTVALALVASAVLISIGLFVALSGTRDECAPPALGRSALWSITAATALAAADQAPGADAIAQDFARWHDVRVRVCRDDSPARVPRLACLDGVLALLDANARALASVQAAPHADVGAVLVDPVVCEAPRLPRIAAAVSDERRTALAATLEATVAQTRLEAAKVDALVARTAGDPCAAVLARLVAANARRSTAERQRDLEAAENAAQRCGDDRLIAASALAVADAAVQLQEADLTMKLERADAAAASVTQPDLRAQLDEMRASVARRADHLDEAIARLEAARDGYSARGRTRAELRIRLQIETLRELRGRPADLAAMSRQLADWHDEAVRKLGPDDPVARELDFASAWWMLVNGDVATAHARLVARARQLPLDLPARASGRVVDEHGAPVVGAKVFAAQTLAADPIGIVPDPSQRTTTTRADGTFELAEAAKDGSMVAELGDRRSPPAKVGEGVTLALEATSRVEGHVELRGEAPTNVTIVVRDPMRKFGELNVFAPVHADGTFTLVGVRRGTMTVHAAVNRLSAEMLSGKTLKIDQPVVRGVELAVKSSKRFVHVIARSTVGMALTRAVVIVMPGQVASSNIAALQQSVQEALQREATPIEREHAPPSVLAVAKPGDVYVTVPEVPDGVATACGLSLPPEANDEDFDRRISEHLDKIEVRCVPIGEHDEVVIIDVPPWPRFD